MQTSSRTFQVLFIAVVHVIGATMGARAIAQNYISPDNAKSVPPATATQPDEYKKLKLKPPTERRAAPGEAERKAGSGPYEIRPYTDEEMAARRVAPVPQDEDLKNLRLEPPKPREEPAVRATTESKPGSGPHYISGEEKPAPRQVNRAAEIPDPHKNLPLNPPPPLSCDPSRVKAIMDRFINGGT